MSTHDGKLKHGAIALIDILGVKGIWARQKTDEVIKIWKSIIEDFEILREDISQIPTNKISIKIHSFSDTLIIEYEGDDTANILSFMATHLTYPFCHSLLEKIYLRGAISVGEFYSSGSMIIGPAIDEAAKWYEHYDWMGISLTPSAGFLIDSYVTNGNGSGWYRKYDIPHKKGVDNGVWVLDWANELPGVMKVLKDSRAPKIALYESFSKPPITPDVLSKYKNTENFYEEMIRNRELEKSLEYTRTVSI
ncbi:hypothetical protein [Candidatus Nitrosarchaeum limnium]|uniref:Guanylate cyclase domain-containing protein n=1 Tax=Candidatus Nitrosarchaeum limnium BG20 TaxID=859192 RepID=S2E9V8_9ARCH|nr:hypothetical protein [Candidatus Nitrosarchaeum limnium]EPA06186.1 hypothetical protein BG20_I0823 [Candidatus Nitrosarchaeum limnium BG20]